MTSELSNKVALVTGGASGIGRASVLALSGAGAAVAVLDRDEAGATAVVAQVKKSGGHASVIVNDLSHTERIPESVASVASGIRTNLLSYKTAQASPESSKPCLRSRTIIGTSCTP